MTVVEKSGIPGLNNGHIRLWFRGQPDGPKYKLTPGVYRPKFNVEDNEKSRLAKERQMAQDFRVESAGLRKGNEESDELYFLMQHYRMPTRLLDWTMNPLVGLYFALKSNESDEKQSGALYLMDAFRLAECQPTSVAAKQKGIATSRNPRFKAALRPIFYWSDPKVHFPNYIMAVRPDHFDKRISQQRSCFTFHGPPARDLTTKENDSLRKFLIPRGTAKKRIRRELSLLGINDFSVFHDLENLSSSLMSAHKVFS